MPTKDSTDTISSQALQADENPWTTANNQDVDSSTQQGDEISKRKRKKRSKHVEDSLPSKWAGRLRTNRLPRTATNQHGEM